MPIAIAVLSLAAAACTPSVGIATQRAAAPKLTKPEKRGRAFAQQRCTRCHAVVRYRLSPNPEAPPFEDIAAREGLTRDTLRAFLLDSHNFPAMMNFEVAPAQIDDLADYMLTMREG